MQIRPDPTLPMPDAANQIAGGREAALARAERRGNQVLLYVPSGPLGGNFACSRCHARALQPDLLDHRAGCLYEPHAGQ